MNLSPLKALSLALFTLLSLSTFGANTTQTVAQVTDSVAITTAVDFVITGETPFTATGKVNIEHTEHAVVIIERIKPSKVITSWLSHLYIKGVKAVSGVNCQVKLFASGAIILPYDSNFRPLTCYTEPNYGGTAYDNYTEGHVGGFMKTLTDANLNNQIRSFKLKRGYMVTFALGQSGWGYSRCFIADKEDLEIPVMPTNMAGRISSYRLFKWQNAKKGSLASSDPKYCGLVNATSGFDWAQGRNLLPDVECVPNHIYEDWPSASTIGSVTWSCHSKNNNEPGNASDDTPQSVDVVLDNWQNLMRTGLRLCSESSHDGSMGHLEAFIDSIDARGWRCDILDLHCYWTQGQFDNLTSYSDRYGNGRPIWISEWLWGAWWNNNGIFALVTSATDFSRSAQQKLLDGTKPILEKLNAHPRVERYFYWNAEERTSLWSKDGADTLSLLGRYFATMNEGLAFNRAYEFIPKVVYRASSNLATRFDNTARTLTLNWNDPNGDMLDSMVVLCKRPGATKFERLASIDLKDMNAKNGPAYSFVDTPANGTNAYRIAIYPVGNTTPKYSNTVSSLVISQKAIWNDVSTTYVTNPGFDESSSWQTTSVTNGTANHKPVTGWTTTCTDANGSSAAFSIGSGLQLNGRTVPGKNTEGVVAGGALGISQGWGVASFYTQKVTLPAGTYRIGYTVYNVANTGAFINLCGYQAGTQSPVYDNATSLQTGSWRTTTFDPFTLIKETDVTLSLGYTSAGGTSTSNPYLFFDKVVIEQADLTNVDDAGEEIVYLDITDSLFVNPGFDTQADNQKANLANGVTNHKKATGWTTVGADTNGSSGVFAIGTPYTLNGKPAPATNATGTVAGGALGISQGWAQLSYYTQAITLSEGTYRMSYAVYNAANPSASFSSRCGYKIGVSAGVYDGISPLPTDMWHIRSMEEFTLTKASSVTFSLGFQAGNNTSTTNPFLFFDFIRLEKAVTKSSLETSLPSLTPATGAYPIAIYNLGGIRLNALQRGINLVKYSDGSVKKILIN